MTPAPSERTGAPSYAERLTLSWWMWPLALVVDAIVALELLMGFSTLPAWIPFTMVVVITVAGLVAAGRLRVAMAADEFQVDDARLPFWAIADVVALDAAGKKEALGVGAHPDAFVVQRPWVGPAVQVLLDDPADPTPYWIVSTRHPVELATALIDASARARAGASS